jgi:hypothetical protein
VTHPHRITLALAPHALEQGAIVDHLDLGAAEPAAQAARAKASERYDAFITALGRRLAKGPKLRQEIPEDEPSDENVQR